MATNLVEPGFTVWDVGANVGLFSFMAASTVSRKGQVFAVEPDPWLQSLLRRSATCTPPSHAVVTVVPAAVAGHFHLAKLSIAKRGRASNFIGNYQDNNNQAGGVRETVPVIALTLDGLMDCLPAPNFVKLDIEGHDFEALQAAERLLERVRPVWAVEVVSANVQPTTALFREHRYRMFKVSGEALVELGRAEWNTVAIPDERVDSVISKQSRKGRE